MTSRVAKLFALLSLAAVVFSYPAMAQQITYYTFDNAAGNSSYKCYDAFIDSADAKSNPLFCFNDYFGSFGSGSNPSIQGTSGSMYLQMNPAVGGTSQSAWFSVPQQVANGFSSYFSFQLTPPVTGTPPNTVTGTPADGIAFVVQNAAGGQAADASTSCQEYNAANFGTVTSSGQKYPPYVPNSGPNVVAGGITPAQPPSTFETIANVGGCIGYSGIDNSLAVEFDTYTDSWDPNSNHIAVQNCGSGVNNASHASGGCLAINDDTNSENTAINDALGLINLSAGNVHQAVVEYSGAQGNPKNELQVFIDPPFVTGTFTPCTATDVTNQSTTLCSVAATPVINVIYDLTKHLSLLSGSSAYVGFTAATGGSNETQNILSWTFTPHSPATQQQPLNDNGTPTMFPFGTHNVVVTYPSGSGSTTIDMVVTAAPISPTNFSALIGPTPFNNSQCQMYDNTGGNCIIYSVSCVPHGETGPPVACPSTDNPVIAVKTAYDSNPSNPPPNPGFLQGDPLYAPISSISVSGTTATVTCSGECSVADQQVVSIVGAVPAGYNVANVTASVSGGSFNSFTFTYPITPPSDPFAGGFVTSNNLQNICNGPSDPPPCFQTAKIDGTTSGKTKNFSDFVALSNTVNTVGTNTSISAPSVPYGTAASIVVSVTPVSGTATATGSVSLTVDGGTPITQSLTSGSATFSVPGLAGGSHPLSASYTPLAQSSFLASSTTGSLLVTTIAPTVTFSGAPGSAPYQSAFPVIATTNASVLPTIIGTAGVCSVGTVGGTAASATAMVSMLSGTGTCTLTATWIADTNYQGTFLQQTSNATKLTPVITWVPASIQLGSPLTSAQLDATASVPGIFGYTPPLGTVVSTTSQAVSALFTPAAPSNYNTATASLNLTVTAGPLAMVSPGSINFGTVYLGSVTTKTVTLTNTGDGPMTVTGPFLSIVKGGNSNEFVEVNQCPKSLAAGKSCSMTIAFVAGPFYTAQTAVLSIMDNAPGNPQTVMLTASVINPQATLSTSSLTFATQKVGTSSGSQSITLKNTGATALAFNGVTVTNADPGDFVVTSTACPASLGTGASCSIGVVFKPAAKSTRTATININDNAQNSPQKVSLSGKGD